ncbi:hypothetical protein SAMN02745857_03339 [Andreprevotia lacus DSM 23236]|uniref:Transmembrane protein n=1 Tax=Andreprevotia lacus DSM 23236 TaxID=1121001 RepID=A0A1W1XXM0_9NEIS|nr:hypothetical protein [Andreprevotia lacus]SMC28615.1 hypothetical protein SAMN02745857_03339 [Andreprevotia lacus DSM 23236]
MNDDLIALMTMAWFLLLVGWPGLMAVALAGWGVLSAWAVWRNKRRLARLSVICVVVLLLGAYAGLWSEWPRQVGGWTGGVLQFAIIFLPPLAEVCLLFALSRLCLRRPTNIAG